MFTQRENIFLFILRKSTDTSSSSLRKIHCFIWNGMAPKVVRVCQCFIGFQCLMKINFNEVLLTFLLSFWITISVTNIGHIYLFPIKKHSNEIEELIDEVPLLIYIKAWHDSNWIDFICFSSIKTFHSHFSIPFQWALSLHLVSINRSKCYGISLSSNKIVDYFKSNKTKIENSSNNQQWNRHLANGWSIQWQENKGNTIQTRTKKKLKKWEKNSFNFLFVAVNSYLSLAYFLDKNQKLP